MNISAKTMKHLLNIYPPYFGAGIKINHICDNWSEMQVSMKVRWYNRNAVGTHFGGSIYSMIDPHLMLMLMQRLGKEYWIWDKAAEIDFVKATKLPISARINITDSQLNEIISETAKGNKYLPQFDIDIRDQNQELIAKVKKVLYVKKRT